ncbi:unnamed protein product [Closterium sp. Naga37s-1]|nr:unnamed protein product [Closterium sp. Naga37s-1]
MAAAPLGGVPPGAGGVQPTAAQAPMPRLHMVQPQPHAPQPQTQPHPQQQQAGQQRRGALKQLVVVVEGTASMGPSWALLRRLYLHPLLKCVPPPTRLSHPLLKCVPPPTRLSHPLLKCVPPPTRLSHPLLKCVPPPTRLSHPLLKCVPPPTRLSHPLLKCVPPPTRLSHPLLKCVPPQRRPAIARPCRSASHSRSTHSSPLLSSPLLSCSSRLFPSNSCSPHRIPVLSSLRSPPCLGLRCSLRSPALPQISIPPLRPLFSLPLPSVPFPPPCPLPPAHPPTSGPNPRSSPRLSAHAMVASPGPSVASTLLHRAGTAAVELALVVYHSHGSFSRAPDLSCTMLNARTHSHLRPSQLRHVAPARCILPSFPLLLFHLQPLVSSTHPPPALIQTPSSTPHFRRP